MSGSYSGIVGWQCDKYIAGVSAMPKPKYRLAWLGLFASAFGSHWLTERPLHRYTSTLQFPLLNSYPAVFDLSGDGGRSTGATLGKMALRTQLCASGRVGAWAKSLSAYSRRFIEQEERESVTNALGEISEAYGQRADSDEDWD